VKPAANLLERPVGRFGGMLTVADPEPTADREVGVIRRLGQLA
jgi:hypothetical protein